MHCETLAWYWIYSLGARHEGGMTGHGIVHPHGPWSQLADD